MAERVLVAMVLRQLVIDLGHRSQRIRNDARRFLADTDGALTFWTTVGGIDADDFRARVEALQRLREP